MENTFSENTLSEYTLLENTLLENILSENALSEDILWENTEVFFNKIISIGKENHALHKKILHFQLNLYLEMMIVAPSSNTLPAPALLLPPKKVKSNLSASSAFT